jgi:hypothetical protein
MSERKGENIACGRKVKGKLIEQLEREIGHQFKSAWEVELCQ